jgi:hypothetical protein
LAVGLRAFKIKKKVEYDGKKEIHRQKKVKKGGKAKKKR